MKLLQTMGWDTTSIYYYIEIVEWLMHSIFSLDFLRSKLCPLWHVRDLYPLRSTIPSLSFIQSYYLYIYYKCWMKTINSYRYYCKMVVCKGIKGPIWIIQKYYHGKTWLTLPLPHHNIIFTVRLNYQKYLCLWMKIIYHINCSILYETYHIAAEIYQFH